MRYRFFLLLVVCFSMMISSVSYSQDPPPPPSHGQTGNQPSAGGTGCPIDRTEGIIFTLVIALSFAGFVLYRKGRQNNNTYKETTRP